MFKPRALLIAILGSLVAVSACSQPSGSWMLNADHSSLSFVSVKNESVLEASHFATLTGSVSEDGNAHVAAQTETLESWVDVRNERMVEHFFQSAQHPQLSVDTQIDLAAYEDMEIGETRRAELTLTVTIVSTPRTVYGDVFVTRAGTDTVIIATAEPVMVDARDFGLGNAVELLESLAGLDSVSPVAAVSVFLVYER
ncbi:MULTISPECIES: YceI family protein [Hyphobacterium]|uniref:YceI family protein n=1 Tax=Hyphobacterium vulgare TaxID=1736751 RepID=A0ABV6ZVR4_9PROT